MEFGVQFFPSVGPELKSAEQYWGEALQLTRHAEQLGFASARTVEHYFHPYGGYSPDPLIFLTAAAAMTTNIRLITGAVLPVFNNPLKLAGQIGMVDAISRGRVEIGFARAFLPHEFARFGITMDESRARFDEGRCCGSRTTTVSRPWSNRRYSLLAGKPARTRQYYFVHL